jgi:hypothetical protein
VTRGVLYVHSAPRAICSHVEWRAEAVLGVPVRLDWTDQPAAPGLVRGEVPWHGAPGTGARLTSALRGWVHLRFEVTEDPAPGVDGARWSHTPELGIFHALTDAHGNIMVPEDRLGAAVASAGHDPHRLLEAIALALGSAWDAELEPFRYAGDGAPVRWLHRVG